MFKDIFHQINGINDFPIIIMLFCFAFFVGVIFFALKMDKEFVNHMSNLPLEDANGSNNHGGSENG